MNNHFISAITLNLINSVAIEDFDDFYKSVKSSNDLYFIKWYMLFTCSEYKTGSEFYPIFFNYGASDYNLIGKYNNITKYNRRLLTLLTKSKV